MSDKDFPDKDYPDKDYHGDVVVFDLDDTLFRERDFVRSGFRLIESIAAQKTGLKPDGSLYSLLNSALEARGRHLDILEEWAKRNGISQNEVGEMIEAYRSHIPEAMSLLPGAKEMIVCLAEKGVRMGIVTDGRTRTQMAKIKALGLERHFRPSDIIISESSGKDKCAPDNFRHFVTQYPEARRFFYIGDNERKDFFVPNLLGWITLKVPYDADNVHEDYSDPDKLSRPAYILPNFNQFIPRFNPQGS